VASIFADSSVTQATVHDLTSGYTWVADGSPVALTGAFMGSFYLNEFWPFAPFNTTTFSKSQINGDYIAFENPARWNYKYGGAVVHTSPLSGGDSFKLSYS